MGASGAGVLIATILLLGPAVAGVADDRSSPARPDARAAGPLFKEVLGFYPYWIAKDEYARMPLDLVSTIAWFSVGANADGTISNPSGWPPTAMISAVHAAGGKVVLTMTSFTDSTTDAVLADPAKVAKHADALLALVQGAGADGVNIDIEGVPKTNSVSGKLNREHLPAYFQALSQKFWGADPAYQISYDLPAVDWSDVWDVAAISPYVTYHMIMGYDYYWKGSANAGSVAPLDNGAGISVGKSVADFLGKGVPKEKLLLGVPYYGYEWPTASDQRGAATQGQGVAKVYNVAVANAAQHGRKWDAEWKTPWYAYQSSGQWYQGHYDDEESLGLKYDHALQQDIGGIGVWALGYDAGLPELWKKIEEMFADRVAPLVSFDSPANGSTVSGVVPVDLNASDDRTLASVRLLLDGTKVGEWTAGPFRFDWDTAATANGAHRLRGEATDAAGNLAAVEIDVTVDNPPPPPPPNDTTPPEVAILAPADGAEVKGDVAIVLDASDETSLATVKLSIDGSPAKEWTAPPFRHLWSATAPGAHRLSAEAFDAAGNRAVYDISVKVTGEPAPKPPYIEWTWPAPGSIVSANTSIMIDFTEMMDVKSVNDAWHIEPAVAGTLVSRTIGGDYFVFTPDEPLPRGTAFRVTVDKSAMSVAKLSMNSSFSFAFSTEMKDADADQNGTSPPQPGPFGLSPPSLAVGLLIGAAAAGALVGLATRKKRKRAVAAPPQDLFPPSPPQ